MRHVPKKERRGITRSSSGRTVLFKLSVVSLSLFLFSPSSVDPTKRRPWGVAAQNDTTASLTPTSAPAAAQGSDAPSDVPSEAPTNVRTTSAPSPQPSNSPAPSTNPTAGSTTAKPSDDPTSAPSGVPTKAPTKATPKPATKTPEPTPSSAVQKATLSDIVALYENVGEVSNTTIIRMLADTEQWFMNSYNNQSYAGRSRTRTRWQQRNLRSWGNDGDAGWAWFSWLPWSSAESPLPSRRNLQQDSTAKAENPADSGVENMRTQIRLVSRRVTSTGLRLVYNQDLQWTEKGERQATQTSASDLVAMPYQYQPTNDVYIGILKTIKGFENVGSPFPLPVIPQAPTPSPTAAPTQAKSSDSSPLSTGAIIGIAVGGAVFLIIVAYCFYSFCCKSDGTTGSSYYNEKDSRMASSSGGGGGAYGSAGYNSSNTPPSRVVTGRDEVSTIDYPRDGVESMGDFQDQRCANRTSIGLVGWRKITDTLTPVLVVLVSQRGDGGLRLFQGVRGCRRHVGRVVGRRDHGRHHTAVGGGRGGGCRRPGRLGRQL
jgi:hypothetical protein